MTEPARPLVLTVALDGESFAQLDALRRHHYPPDRNHVPAHLTLFHSLPGDRLAVIEADLVAISSRQRPFLLAATGYKPLGEGVALSFSSSEFLSLRQRLAREWRDDLTTRDSSRIAPHVTIQNKVTPREANALLHELRAGFRTFTARAEGLLLWRYLGGPWKLVRRFGFAG